MNERIAIGVDAGGSTTVAALSSDGAYRASAYGGPANASSLGTALAASAIVATVREVAAGAAVGSIFVGAAGAGRAAARDALAAELRAHFTAATIAVEDDLRVALRAGIAEGPGVVLVAGTGSVAYAEHAERRVRVGGAGYLAGDEGSAFAIGLGALKRLARVYDGRERADETSGAVAAAFAAPDLDALLDAIYGGGPPDVARIAALAPLVIAGADRGDRGATKLVQGAAQELGDLVRAAARGAELSEPAVVFAGGLLQTNSLLSFLLEARVTNELPGVQIVRVREEPARAALRLAEAL